MSNASDTTLTLLTLGALFLVGLAADLLGRRSFMPRVTLLLLGGLALGPAGLSLIPTYFLETWFPALTVVALALVGFLLGQQISLPSLRKRGRQVIGISVCKVASAATAVLATLLAFGVDPVIAALLAAIAPATAPAATYEVVHELEASGDFTDTLLSIVAIDDVWGLLLFSLTIAFVGDYAGAGALLPGVVDALGEVFGSIALGIAMGVPMALLTGRVQSGEPTLAEALGFVLLGAGIAQWLGQSPVLTAMAMGCIVASTARHHDRPFHAIEGIEWPFMILFFVLAGASLDLGVLGAVGGITAAYVVARGAGIYIGTRIGATAAGAERPLRRWLGLTLFPQAGVAIGMALLASQRFPDLAPVILPTVLASSVFLELFAPVVTRWAIRAATSSGAPSAAE